MCNVYIYSISLYLALSAVKHSQSKLNQQINDKEGKGKKRNASGIALNRPTRRAESSADIYTFTKKLNVQFICLFVLVDY